MTHIDQMLYWFRQRQNRATLGEILKSGEPWSYEFRARMTDARHKGHNFVCEKGCSPSANLYTLVEPDATGQFQMFPQEQKVRYH